GSTDVELVVASSRDTAGRDPVSVAATATPDASSTAAATPATTRARMSLSITTVLQGSDSRFSSVSATLCSRHNDWREKELGRSWCSSLCHHEGHAVVHLEGPAVALCHRR